MIHTILSCLLLITVCASCNNKTKLCSEENTLAIIPKVGVGKYKLGMSEESLKTLLCNNYKKKSLDSWFSNQKGDLYMIENMSFIVNNKHLQEINVWGSFQGDFEGIDVNYDITDLKEMGEIVEYKNEYRILNIPGIGFGNLKDEDEGKFIRVFDN